MNHSMTLSSRVFALVVGLGTVSSCALLSKAEPLSLRFLSPHVIAHEDARIGARDASVELRLGSVEAVSHLDQRVAFRIQETEVGYYYNFRWTEPPDAYLRRALSEELFDRRAAKRIVTGAGPTLDVELESFEELRFGTPRARIAFRFVLRDERRALIERRVLIEQPIQGVAKNNSVEHLASALSEALAQSVTKVADDVLGVLNAEAVPSALPSPAPASDVAPR